MKNILEAIEGGHPSDEAVFKTVFDHTDDLSAEALTHMPEALERGRRTYNEMRRAGPEREG
jgi:hypothetical protein